MDIVQADEVLAEKYADDIAELVYSTGPISYDYHFGTRKVHDAVVRGSWLTPGTLFAYDQTHLALEGDRLMGIEIGFHAPEFRSRAEALGQVWQPLIASGEVDEQALKTVAAHAEYASWLNPVTRANRYYIHALAVKPEFRGKQVGVALISHAKQQCLDMGFKRLELDVLSDNPAVHFYYSQGLELLVESRAPKPEAFGVPPEWRMGIDL